jgi:signal peptidase II
LTESCVRRELPESWQTGRAWPWFVAALSLIILDQITKAIVRYSMHIHESIPLIGTNFLKLTYVSNPGVAFGVEILGRWFLIALNLIAAVFLVFYLIRLARKKNLLCWPMMLFLAGAIGNTIDRIFIGEVVDFVDIDFPDIIMERWPVFNVADSCVTIGIVFVLILVLFDQSKASPSTAQTLETGEDSSSGGNPAENNARISSPSDPFSDHDRDRTTPAAD